ncbi:protein-glutamate methylesterase/protein-glutamine glutaminase [Zavarzinia aquatilis]|uniref:Protein-glutamate methylesterase/protein-glutamine glutaminase n=1 Tax=Zavarzinia aquatilis TaxID=2211142 RepID=A0A317DX10_9PROT|nr:chemotaxis response regulator protein-glutamate methylesterase [Zavarzinia aquatilis]PWR18396.1 chemotaxis response regulator protein-glutamate methylesterase [Zavarzinia aquatilis]
MTAGGTIPEGRPGDAAPLRAMIVDDSAVIRGMVARWLTAEPDIEVVATAPNGAMAIRQLARVAPEVIVLDVEMPEMDGLTALPEILRLACNAKVLMSSTLTRAGAEISLKALSLGAADYLAKPSSTRETNAVEAFRRDLVDKVRALGAAVRRHRGRSRPETAPVSAPAAATVVATEPRVSRLSPSAPIVTRPAGPIRPQLLAIGSSTGGPQALATLLGPLASRLDVPILITQHMPATFTAIMAEHLTKATGVPAAEGRDGEMVQGRRIYVAPGGFHMVVERQGMNRVLRLNTEPPENFCRPSVDPMLRSVAAAYGAASLVVILTGMGQDGLNGSRAVVEAGGTIIAQDEASSVVWGMPGAVAGAGLCSAVLPLGEIGATVERLLRGPALAGVR